MRRLASTAIVLVALLLATLAAVPGVSAQAADEHPAVGAWLVDPSPQDSTDPLELLTVAPGGIITYASPDGTGYGSWAATGERNLDATFLLPQRDPACGCLVGYATVRTSTEVAEDGQSFAGSYTLEPPAGMAMAMGAPLGQLGPGEVTGQRIAVEPVGEPVGPLPEEGDPEPAGSAAPDASVSPSASTAVRNLIDPDDILAGAARFGDLVFTAGFLGLAAGDDFDADVNDALDQLEATLDRSGAGFDTLLRVNVYLTDWDDWEAYNRIYQERIGEYGPPPRTTVEVSRLGLEAPIEIAAVAHVRSSNP
jgi:2-iminobutanoate/2-iminopropanoate deaminase